MSHLIRCHASGYHTPKGIVYFGSPERIICEFTLRTISSGWRETYHSHIRYKNGYFKYRNCSDRRFKGFSQYYEGCRYLIIVNPDTDDIIIFKKDRLITNGRYRVIWKEFSRSVTASGKILIDDPRSHESSAEFQRGRLILVKQSEKFIRSVNFGSFGIRDIPNVPGQRHIYYNQHNIADFRTMDGNPIKIYEVWLLCKCDMIIISCSDGVFIVDIESESAIAARPEIRIKTCDAIRIKMRGLNSIRESDSRILIQKTE